MDSALYNAASGLIVQQTHLDVTTNNLANINTPGFRKDGIFIREMVRYADAGGFSGDVNGTVGVPSTFTLDRAGTPVPTGEPTDLALFGPGLFTVDTPAGTRYTRDGVFTLDAEGYLSTERGHRVMGESGPLRLPSGEITVSSDGTVSASGEAVGRLRLVEIPASEQVKVGEGLLLPNSAGAVTPAGPRTLVRQGFREGSGVNALEEMVEMISAQRAFQTYEKVLGLVVNEVDRRAVSDIAGQI